MPSLKPRGLIGLVPLLCAMAGIVMATTSCKIVTCRHEGTVKMTALTKNYPLPGSTTAGEVRTRGRWYSDGVDCFNSGNTAVHSMAGYPSGFWERCYAAFGVDGTVNPPGDCTHHTTNDVPTYVAHETHGIFHALADEGAPSYVLTSKVFIHRSNSNMSSKCYLLGPLPPRTRTACLGAQSQ
jgi:hypothetical protein